MPQYKPLPDGQTGRFPDDWDEAKIQSAIKERYPSYEKTVFEKAGDPYSAGAALDVVRGAVSGTAHLAGLASKAAVLPAAVAGRIGQTVAEKITGKKSTAIDPANNYLDWQDKLLAKFDRAIDEGPKGPSLSAFGMEIRPFRLAGELLPGAVGGEAFVAAGKALPLLGRLQRVSSASTEAVPRLLAAGTRLTGRIASSGVVAGTLSSADKLFDAARSRTVEEAKKNLKEGVFDFGAGLGMGSAFHASSEGIHIVRAIGRGKAARENLFAALQAETPESIAEEASRVKSERKAALTGDKEAFELAVRLKQSHKRVENLEPRALMMNSLVSISERLDALHATMRAKVGQPSVEDLESLGQLRLEAKQLYGELRAMHGNTLASPIEEASVLNKMVDRLENDAGATFVPQRLQKEYRSFREETADAIMHGATESEAHKSFLEGTRPRGESDPFAAGERGTGDKSSTPETPAEKARNDELAKQYRERVAKEEADLGAINEQMTAATRQQRYGQSRSVGGSPSKSGVSDPRVPFIEQKRSMSRIYRTPSELLKQRTSTIFKELAGWQNNISDIEGKLGAIAEAVAKRGIPASDWDPMFKPSHLDDALRIKLENEIRERIDLAHQRSRGPNVTPPDKSLDQILDEYTKRMAIAREMAQNRPIAGNAEAALETRKGEILAPLSFKESYGLYERKWHGIDKSKLSPEAKWQEQKELNHLLSLRAKEAGNRLAEIKYRVFEGFDGFVRTLAGGREAIRRVIDPISFLDEGQVQPFRDANGIVEWVNSVAMRKLEEGFKDFNSKLLELTTVAMDSKATGYRGTRSREITVPPDSPVATAVHATELVLDDLYGYFVKKGALAATSFRQNMIPRIYKKQDWSGVEEFFQKNRPYDAANPHNLHRFFDDLQAARLAGFEPLTLNAKDLIAEYTRNLAQTGAANHLINELQLKAPEGTFLRIDANKFAPPGYTEITAKYPNSHILPEDGTRASKLVVKSDLGRVLDNYFNQSKLQDWTPTKVANNWNAAVKHLTLMLDSYHLFQMSRVAAALNINPLVGWKAGLKMLDSSNLHHKLIRDGVQHYNLRLDSGDWSRVEGEITKGLLRSGVDSVNKIPFLKFFNELLWKNMVPGFKAVAYQRTFQRLMNNPEFAGHPEKVGLAAGKFVNEAFGGIAWSQFGRDRTMSNLGRWFILAPDWMETRFRMVLGDTWHTKSNKSLEQQMASSAKTNWAMNYIAQGLAVNGMTNFILQNIIHTGDAKDLPKPTDVAYWTGISVPAADKWGYALRVSPFATFEYVFEFMNHPERFMQGRLGPLAQLGKTVVTGMDWRGKPMTGGGVEGWENRAKLIVDALMPHPIPFSSLEKVTGAAADQRAYAIFGNLARLTGFHSTTNFPVDLQTEMFALEAEAADLSIRLNQLRTLNMNLAADAFLDSYQRKVERFWKKVEKAHYGEPLLKSQQYERKRMNPKDPGPSK